MEKTYEATAFCGMLFLVPMPRIGRVRGVSRSGVWRCAPAFIFQKGSVYSFSLKLKILPNHSYVGIGRRTFFVRSERTKVSIGGNKIPKRGNKVRILGIYVRIRGKNWLLGRGRKCKGKSNPVNVGKDVSFSVVCAMRLFLKTNPKGLSIFDAVRQG